MKTRMNYVPDNLNIFAGFYESELYNSDMEYDYNYNERSEYEHYLDCEIDNFNEYKIDVCTGIAKELAEYLVDDDICDDVEFMDMSSPREYNFTTDKLILSVNIDIEKLTKKVWEDENLHNGFDKYLQRKYTSRSGYISFVENNIKDYMEKKEYADVLIDYWLLTKIYDDADVVKAIEKMDWTYYHERVFEIANNVLYDHMKPISEEDYIFNVLREDKMQDWARTKFAVNQSWFGTEFAERIMNECKDEFYAVAGVLRYEQYDNVKQYLN